MMNARPITVKLAYRTLLTNFEKSAPATRAGMVATTIINAKWRARGSVGRPVITATIFWR